MRRFLERLAASTLVLFGINALDAMSADGVSKSQLHSKVLELANMPNGWSVDNSSSAASGFHGCLSGLMALEKPTKAVAVVHVQYEDQMLPGLSEYVQGGKTPKESAELYSKYIKTLNGCKTFSYTVQGQQASGNVGQMSFPEFGDASGAYEVNVSIGGESAGADVVILRVGDFVANLSYSDYSPDPLTAQAFATEAAQKLEGKPVTVPSSP